MGFVNLESKYRLKEKRYKSQSGKGIKRVLVILAILILAIGLPSIFIAWGAKDAATHGKALVSTFESQNFDNFHQEVKATKSAMQKANIGLNFLFWLQIIPFVGGYYSDAKGLSAAGVQELKALDTLLSKLSKDKAELGFDNHPKSGPDRISQAIKVLDKSLPYVDEVEPNFKNAADNVRDINTGKYPEKFRGKEVRRNLEVLKNFILGAEVAVKEGKGALKIAPEALGLTKPKTYLMLFQNDKEIRPTGGFITAFATITLSNGQVNATTSDDIYRLDEKLLEVCKNKVCPLRPPAPIVKYLPEVSGKPRSAWSMRDSNISPNLPTSAAEFERMYQLLGEGLPFDGIIFIDTQVVEELIELTGPIDVLGTTYSSEIDKRCNCPNVIYELESYAEIAAKGEKDRKAVLGVLMQQILARTIGSDIEKMPQLIETIARLANHKHVMFYMHNGESQKALSSLNWTGEIKDFDGDYLHINDSNFAGGKSNIYVEQTVTQEITPQKDGTVKKKIQIEYRNPQPFNTWLNGINRDYVRFYVPKGSKLLSSRGSEVAMTTIEDLDKTVFEGFIQVRPENTRKLEIEYTVPYDPKGDYKLMIQKQPGAKDFHYIIKVNGSKKEDFLLENDRVVEFGV